MRNFLFTFIFLLMPAIGFAQSTVSLGGLSIDAGAPVEIAADRFSLDQGAGTAAFEGNVVIGQGNMRISAGRIEVTYQADQSRIASLRSSGRTTFVTATEAVEADRAIYDIDGETLQLSGNVILTQGPNVISADEMFVNLAAGTARLNGNVRSILNTNGN